MHLATIVAASLVLCATAPASEGTRAHAQREALAAEADEEVPPDLDGTLATYVRAATLDNPAVHAAYSLWASDVSAIRGAAAPPEPTIAIGLFARSVETRVGPQQARLSLQQTLPWPTELVGKHDAAVARAELSRARFEATTIAISATVRDRYWTLWEVRTTRQTHRAHMAVLDDLSATLRARLEVGTATLADLQQLDLSRARLADAILSMDARESRALAALRAVLGRSSGSLPTSDHPSSLIPALDLEEVTRLALRHPDLDAAHAREQVAAAAARVARSQQGPGWMIGADWIVTGAAAAPDLPDSGKDAVMVGLGIRLPLWQGAYKADIAAARALQETRGAETDALQLMVRAMVEDAFVRVTDGARRVDVVQSTLLPLADATYTSLLGAYAVGRSTAAQVLLAQRDLLELQVQLDQTRAELERAWAELERLCGADLMRDHRSEP